MFSLGLQYTGWPIKKREYNAALKGVNARVAEEWHEEFLPKHFTQEGAKEYRYAKRKGEGMAPGAKGYASSYTGRKQRKFGHTDPLVFTGTARALAKIRIVRATRDWGKVVLPSVFNFKHPKSRIVMREEVTRVSAPEIIHLRKIAEYELDRQLRVVTKT